jgi:hypothetical protein
MDIEDIKNLNRLTEDIKCRLDDNSNFYANTVETRPDDLTIDCCVFIKVPIDHIVIDYKFNLTKGE